jgi:hypothetical protein
MRATVVFSILVALLTVSPPLATATFDGPAGPAMVTAVQWDAGTLLAWTPAPEPGAIYNVYRGETPETMVRIARTATTQYYDFNGDAGTDWLYAVTSELSGKESTPTFQTACVSVGLNGSVVVRPHSCLPLP